MLHSNSSPEEERVKITWPFIFSILFHLSVVSILAMVPGLFPQLFLKNKYQAPQRNIVELNLLDKEELLHLRNLGKKDGSKKNSIHLPKQKKLPPVASTDSLPAPTQNQKTNRQSRGHLEENLPQKPLSFDQIRTTQAAVISQFQGQYLAQKAKEAQEKVAKAAKKSSKKKNQESDLSQLLKEMTNTDKVSRAQQQFLESTNLDIEFEVPEGVDLTKLNEKELVFYSFRKRIAQNYISTLLSSYTKFKRANPRLRFPSSNLREHITGRVTYDRNGNPKAFKIIRWSQDDKVQEFFEQVLSNISDLPNPPKMLIQNKNEFAVYYSIVIN